MNVGDDIIPIVPALRPDQFKKKEQPLQKSPSYRNLRLSDFVITTPNIWSLYEKEKYRIARHRIFTRRNLS